MKRYFHKFFDCQDSVRVKFRSNFHTTVDENNRNFFSKKIFHQIIGLISIGKNDTFTSILPKAPKISVNFSQIWLKPNSISIPQ